jgi:hypothetical protein
MFGRRMVAGSGGGCVAVVVAFRKNLGHVALLRWEKRALGNAMVLPFDDNDDDDDAALGAFFATNRLMKMSFTFRQKLKSYGTNKNTYILIVSSLSLDPDYAGLFSFSVFCCFLLFNHDDSNLLLQSR